MLWTSLHSPVVSAYEGVSKGFRTGLPEQELLMVQLSATRCSCIAVLLVSLVSFAAITLCIASQRVFIVVSLYFVIDSVRKLLDTPLYAAVKNRRNSLPVFFLSVDYPPNFCVYFSSP
jgi:hypothetical protein